MTGFAVNGATGRMGRRITALLAETPDSELVCALEAPDHPDVGKDAGTLAGIGEIGVAIRDQLAGDPDVLLDFSSPAATVERALECAGQGVAVVIGTTGLSDAQIATIRQEVACAVPVLRAPNMSVGVNVLFELVGQVARALGDQYDIEIVEAHHRRKADAPSGTALKLAERICEAMSWDPAEAMVHGRQGKTGERPRRQLGVHAVRGGDVVGDHTVLFAGEGERIELTHRAGSRDVFVLGAIRAGRFLAGRPAGLYTMQDVLAGK